MIAIAIALPVGIWLPDVLGGGSNLIDTAEHARVGLGMLCLLFVAKMLFTSTSFGSGAPGGIFMPILAVGSLAGGICGEVLHRFGDLPSDAVAVFAVCVMTGTLAASVKTPITSILLAVEMSGTLTHMLPVAAVAFIALLVSDLLRTKPIYGELLGAGTCARKACRWRSQAMWAAALWNCHWKWERLRTASGCVTCVGRLGA